jgi:hypothetical protein
LNNEFFLFHGFDLPVCTWQDDCTITILHHVGFIPVAPEN